MTSKPPLRALCLVAALAVEQIAAASPTTDACLDAYEQAQELRRGTQLQRAREKLLVCSRDPCPAALRGDCVSWLEQVEVAIPSVVLAARDARGKDVTDVRVSVDGRPLADRLDARAVQLDPGPHLFTFVPRHGPAQEERVLLREGEKAREIRVDLTADVPDTVAPAPEGPPQRGSGAALGWPVYALGATGILALGVFSYFGLSGRSDYIACKSGCALPQRENIKREFLTADVALGVSVLALGAALYFVLTNGRPPIKRPVALTVELSRGAPRTQLTIPF